MRSTYLLYLATRPDPAPARRCCSDQPPQDRPSRTAPVWPVRWARKAARGSFASLRVFRRSLELPVEGTMAGTAVITKEGTHVGLITDEVVALRSGRAALVVERVQDREPASVVLLVPPDAIDRSRGDGVAVIEATWEERPVA